MPPLNLADADLKRIHSLDNYQLPPIDICWRAEQNKSLKVAFERCTSRKLSNSAHSTGRTLSISHVKAAQSIYTEAGKSLKD